jgi:hypothetical protein
MFAFILLCLFTSAPLPLCLCSRIARHLPYGMNSAAIAWSLACSRSYFHYAGDLRTFFLFLHLFRLYGSVTAPRCR